MQIPLKYHFRLSYNISFSNCDRNIQRKFWYQLDYFYHVFALFCFGKAHCTSYSVKYNFRWFGYNMLLTEISKGNGNFEIDRIILPCLYIEHGTLRENIFTMFWHCSAKAHHTLHPVIHRETATRPSFSWHLVSICGVNGFSWRGSCVENLVQHWVIGSYPSRAMFLRQWGFMHFIKGVFCFL